MATPVTAPHRLRPLLRRTLPPSFILRRTPHLAGRDSAKGWKPVGDPGGVRAGEAVSEVFTRSSPTITESVRRRNKPRGVGFPFDSSRKFAMTEVFPLEEIGREVVKIKSIPIRFRWTSNGGPEEGVPKAGKESFKSIHPVIKGPTRQRPWFRPPPKVRIVPGILGRMPRDETRVGHRSGGETEVREDSVSAHRSSFTSPGCSAFPFQSQIATPPNPNPSPPSEPLNPSPPKSKTSNLTKFIGCSYQVLCIRGAVKTYGYGVREDEPRGESLQLFWAGPSWWWWRLRPRWRWRWWPWLGW